MPGPEQVGIGVVVSAAGDRVQREVVDDAVQPCAWLRHGLATNAVSRQRRSTMRNETNNVPAPRDQSGGYNLATGRVVAIVARSAADIRQVSIRRPIA